MQIFVRVMTYTHKYIWWCKWIIYIFFYIRFLAFESALYNNSRRSKKSQIVYMIQTPGPRIYMYTAGIYVISYNNIYFIKYNFRVFAWRGRAVLWYIEWSAGMGGGLVERPWMSFAIYLQGHIPTRIIIKYTSCVRFYYVHNIIYIYIVYALYIIYYDYYVLARLGVNHCNIIITEMIVHWRPKCVFHLPIPTVCIGTHIFYIIHYYNDMVLCTNAAVISGIWK